MDVMMEIRRRLLEIAGGGDVGADFVKGTTTIGSSNTHTISFGKTFSRYMYFIEMTDGAKADLISSGQTAAKMYACCGIYPSVPINNAAPSNVLFAYRMNPNTSEKSTAAGSSVQSIDGSSITITSGQYSGGTNILYRGLEYNYYIVEIK